jgi:hypothetical protein
MTFVTPTRMGRPRRLGEAMRGPPVLRGEAGAEGAVEAARVELVETAVVSRQGRRGGCILKRD